jgi:Protein of unknown function (DUF429)
MRLARIDLKQIVHCAIRDDNQAIASLGRAISATLPSACTPAVALVDSPRWPCDLDYSRDGVVQRLKHRGGRAIDSALRALVRSLRDPGEKGALTPLSLFPTPRFEYFAARLIRDDCKPHLRALGHEVFAGALQESFGALNGGTFTRFMIAGFATYRALATLGVDSYECYPDLQFRLWSTEETLPPKAKRREALPARQRIIAKLARDLSTIQICEIKTLDAADAAIVALSTAMAMRKGALAMVEVTEEGRFLLALDVADGARASLALKSRLLASSEPADSSSSDVPGVLTRAQRL